MDNPKGSFHFQAAREISGLYEICFQTNTTHWFKKSELVEFHLKIEVDEDASKYDQVESKTRVESM